MCYPATCKSCGKTTWKGCGQHADEVMRGVPAAQRCRGHEAEPSTGLFGRLFARR